MVHRVALEPREYSREFNPPIDDVLLARLSLGSPNLDLSLVPGRMTIARLKGHLPDVLGWSIGPFIVTGFIKETLEALEPNTHKFKSVEVSMSDRPEAATTAYHILLPPPVVDAIDIDRTMFVKGLGRAGYDASVRIKVINWLDPDVRVGALQAKLIGRHLWRLPEEYRFEYMCSDRLWSILTKNGVVGWQSSKHFE